MSYRHYAQWAAALAVPISLWLPAPAASAAEQVSEPIVNGVATTGFPPVGLLTYEGVECTVTLIGCRTVLTAAHCVCYDASEGVFGLLFGDHCRARPDVYGPEGKRVFFQHAGYFDLAAVDIDPDWGVSGGAHDVAVLHLARLVTGIRPSAINETGKVPVGTTATVVGFGRTRTDIPDEAIKRFGTVTTTGVDCPDGVVCWRLEDPLGPAGSDSGICYNDSGGPMFADLGAGPVVAGLHNSGTSPSCEAPATNFATEVFANRGWIAQAAGADRGTGACGHLPQVGEPGTRISGFRGGLAEGRALDLSIEVAPGTRLLRVALNTEGTVEPVLNDFDLFVQQGSPPSSDASADCAGTRPEGLESCEIDNPAPGSWSARVEARQGSGTYQLVVTQFDDEAIPPPPAGPWLTSPELIGFEAKARLGGENGVPGAIESDCIPESLCLSGALPGRAEVFLKVIGPRPNGYLWLQVSRFTPSRVDLWVRRTATDRTNYYVLGAVSPASDGVPGLQDRLAFEP